MLRFMVNREGEAGASLHGEQKSPTGVRDLLLVCAQDYELCSVAMAFISVRKSWF